ncbi:MAG: c-type cytochrome [Chloroflexi bacterium]|nr:c-type cytochrome [Chloroflexota bacterium]
MSEDRTGRELTPRPSERELSERELTPRQHGAGSVERFYAGDSAHTVGLSEERAAGIVRQSGNARSVAFLATLVIVLFVPLYWFYDLGFPGVAGTSRLENEVQAQLVTDVARGHELYLANCARCHGENGEGGIGPALNDQAKLYNAITEDGQAGNGHLNTRYLELVLNVGGRYVCGDPESVMPVWLNENGGPLNYREIEEIVRFIVASDEITWTSEGHREAGDEDGEEDTGPEVMSGWRDTDYVPPPDATPVPECWRRPEGEDTGGSAPMPPDAIEVPGTEESPRVIAVEETANVQITDPEGNQLAAIAVQEGETVTFEVTNTSGEVPHNFYIGPPEQLEGNQVEELPGVPEFTEGTQTFTYTVEAATDAELEFACTVLGHYPTMHGAIQVIPAGDGAGDEGEGE